MPAKQLLTGNEAIARGAWEAGVHFASAYPGTPSTEILEALAQHQDVAAEWAPNEKVAVEAAIGASIAGGRAMASMKMVGVNVAADPIFTYAYMQVNGGFMFVSADDPGMHSSQNEQDNRLYAEFAKIAMLEPSDSQECRDMAKAAFEISETYHVIVMMRTTTRINHSKSLVEVGERAENPFKPYDRQLGITEFNAVPTLSRHYRVALEKRLAKLAEYAEETPFNFIEWHSKKIGIVTSGAAYNYAKEVFGEDASYLKLGFTSPLPLQKIKSFASQVEQVYVIEELEPYLEKHLKAAGIACIGKAKIPNIGELNPNIIRAAFFPAQQETLQAPAEMIVQRPPTFCAGCPHRGFFYVIGKIKNLMITSDIGCYGLSSAPPLNAKDTCICMGASAGTGHGAQCILDMKGEKQRVIAVMGDSTFFATGLNGLENAIYNKSRLITCVLDNRTTAMTGHQENPGTGFTAQGEIAEMIDIAAVATALGCRHVRTFNPNDLDEVKAVMDWAMALDEASVIIARYPCALKRYSEADKAEFGIRTVRYAVDQDKCIGCKKCVKTGCPAIHFQFDQKKSFIHPEQCVGCGVCAQVCPVQAIQPMEGKS